MVEVGLLIQCHYSISDSLVISKCSSRGLRTTAGGQPSPFATGWVAIREAPADGPQGTPDFGKSVDGTGVWWRRDGTSRTSLAETSRFRPDRPRVHRTGAAIWWFRPHDCWVFGVWRMGVLRAELVPSLASSAHDEKTMGITCRELISYVSIFIIKLTFAAQCLS
jgi:hypothetical protein